MKVFKFGGVSVRNAEGVRNLAEIVSKHAREGQVFVVVSAMGKTTNALESLLEQAWQGEDYSAAWRELEQKHLEIGQALAIDLSPTKQLFAELKTFLQELTRQAHYDQAYDAIVSQGELASTRIIAQYLQKIGLPCQWLDARQLIHTDHTWRDGRVQWQITQTIIQQQFSKLASSTIGLTQGFIASNLEGQTTTLGREGSDFTGAIFAHCLQAESLTIWKDVPGVLNADPRKVQDTALYREISYHEAAEMSKYGASVIHPKTIAPLAQKNIPLFVRSFLQPDAPGTAIANFAQALNPHLPAIIFKENQVLIEVAAKSFSFLTESDLALICNRVAELKLPLNLLHKSATKCQLCASNWASKISTLTQSLEAYFDVQVREGLRLISLKYADAAKRQEVLANQDILLSEESAEVYQYIVSAV